MNWEQLALETKEEEGGKRSIQVFGDSKLTWDAKLFAHNPAWRAHIPSRANRLKIMAVDGRMAFGATTFLDVDLPPTAFFSRCFDSLITNVKVPIRLGQSYCHPYDLYDKSVGRKLAEKNASVCEAEVEEIYRDHKTNLTVVLRVSTKEETFRLHVKVNRHGKMFISVDRVSI